MYQHLCQLQRQAYQVAFVCLSIKALGKGSKAALDSFLQKEEVSPVTLLFCLFILLLCISLDGTLWVPSKNSLICSDHFVGGSKHCHPHHKGYNPTIFRPNVPRPVLLPPPNAPSLVPQIQELSFIDTQNWPEEMQPSSESPPPTRQVIQQTPPPPLLLPPSTGKRPDRLER